MISPSPETNTARRAPEDGRPGRAGAHGARAGGRCSNPNSAVRRVLQLAWPDGADLGDHPGPDGRRSAAPAARGESVLPQGRSEETARRSCPADRRAGRRSVRRPAADGRSRCSSTPTRRRSWPSWARSSGNTMTNVSPTNLKLIGRATYPHPVPRQRRPGRPGWVKAFGARKPVAYGEANAVLFDAIAFLKDKPAEAGRRPRCRSRSSAFWSRCGRSAASAERGRAGALSRRWAWPRYLADGADSPAGRKARIRPRALSSRPSGRKPNLFPRRNDCDLP